MNFLLYPNLKILVQCNTPMVASFLKIPNPFIDNLTSHNHQFGTDIFMLAPKRQSYILASMFHEIKS